MSSNKFSYGYENGVRVNFVALLLISAEERKGCVAPDADQWGKGSWQGDAWWKKVAVIVVVEEIESLRQDESECKNASIRHAEKKNILQSLLFSKW